MHDSKGRPSAQNPAVLLLAWTLFACGQGPPTSPADGGCDGAPCDAEPRPTDVGPCPEAGCGPVCSDSGPCPPDAGCTGAPVRGPDGQVAGGCDPDEPPRVEEVSLGTTRLTAGARPVPFDLQLPRDAVSVTFRAQALSEKDVPLAFTRLIAPGARTWLDFLELAQFVDQPIRWLPLDSFETIAMLVPNTTPNRAKLRAGPYALRVGALQAQQGDDRQAQVQVSALIKRAPDALGSALHLNVFPVGLGMTAAQAARSGRVKAVMDELDRILTAAGLTLGRIRYFGLPQADIEGLEVIDSSGAPDSEFARLLRLGEGRSGLSLDVFLVRSIRSGESGGVSLGLSGGLPGPPGLHGTGHSGVAVAFDPAVVGEGHRTAAQILAHEIGHFLGLYHTTEAAPPCAEGQEPTPSDPCAPFGGDDVLADTEYGDGSNLMYFALGGEDGHTYNVELTKGQAFVMKRSALVTARR